MMIYIIYMSNNYGPKIVTDGLILSQTDVLQNYNATKGMFGL